MGQIMRIRHHRPKKLDIIMARLDCSTISMNEERFESEHLSTAQLRVA